MAHETLPSQDVGAQIDQYNKDRSTVVGRDLMKSGFKAAAVGIFAAATYLASKYYLAVTIAGTTAAVVNGGALLAGGAIAYGGLKLIEGIGKRIRGMRSGSGGGGHH